MIDQRTCEIERQHAYTSMKISELSDGRLTEDLPFKTQHEEVQI